MATDLAVSTLDDLVRDMGEIALHRIRGRPPLGTATEADLIEFNRRGTPQSELIDGVLVEKAKSYIESILAMVLGTYLRQFFVPKNLGHVYGPTE